MSDTPADSPITEIIDAGNEPIKEVINAGNPVAFLTAIADAGHIGAHTRTDCPDPTRHLELADEMAIPKCASNRESNLDADGYASRYCVSAYCPRCQEMRHYYGEPQIVPNSWLNDLDNMETEKAEAEQRRADALAIMVNMSTTHFAPDARTQHGSAQLDEMLGIAESLRAKRETWGRESKCQHDPEIVWRAMFEASRLVYPDHNSIKSSYLLIAHSFMHFIAGEYTFDVPEDTP